MKKIKVITIISGIVLTIILVLGSSYALFYSESNFTNEETYITGILDIELVDEEGYNTSLTLSNSLPITDEEGKQTTPFKLKLRNVGNLSYTFNVKLINTTTENSINPNYIKVMIDDNEPVTLSSLTDSLIASDITLNPEEEKVIEVRIWLDISTPNSEIGKTFTGKITTDGVGEEYIPPEVLQLDISKGSITIDEGSDDTKLYVTGGGLTEQVEIDNILPIIITGSATNNGGILVNSGTANIILNNVNISGSAGTFRLLSGTVNLTLNGTNTLDASSSYTTSSTGCGIYVNYVSALTINGDGTLNVIGIASGIGSYVMNYGTGTIIINGGTINASSTGTGAGIEVGTLLEINGGNITAISNHMEHSGSGAGIGGAREKSVPGTIRINGGTVYAKGGFGAAGIGGGGTGEAYCTDQTTAPNIYISDNANVTAIAGILDGVELTIPPQNIGNGGFSC